MRIVATVLGASRAAQKLVGVGLGVSLLGTTIHLGVSKPINQSKEAEHLLGSQRLLENRKGNPYDNAYNDSYLVKDFHSQNDLPPVFPALTMNHVRGDLREPLMKEFNGSIQNRFRKTPEPLRKSYESTLLARGARLASLDKKTASISEIDITYKSYFYNKQVRDLDEDHLLHDLIWSLAEDSTENKTIIRPDSISISFQLEKVNNDLDEQFEKNMFPLLANKVRNFNIRFKIYNPNNTLAKVFKSIKILPNHEVDLSVRLDNAEIRPFYVSFYPPVETRNSIRWGLIPLGKSKFQVTQISTFPQSSAKLQTLDRLSLIYGKSRFVEQIFSNPPIVNTPTYKNFSDVATPIMVNITPDQIKKDLEVWYGAATAFQLNLIIKDINKLVDVMDVDIFKDSNGNMHSGLDMLVESSTFRNSIYAIIGLNDDAAKVIEQFFDKSPNNPNRIEFEQLKYLMKSVKTQLTKMRDNMEVKITWEQEPTLSQSDENDFSPFQSVSFKFSQELLWKEKVELPFKGCWDESNQEYTSADTSKSCTGSKKWFDFTKKINQLQTLLSPVANLINPMIMNLLPDAGQFLGWDKWEIDKDEKVITTYSALKSPIRPAISESSDKWEKMSVVPGWKAMDISTSYNLQNFHKFFYKIYEKIDAYKDTKHTVNVTNWVSAIASAANIASAAKKNPVSFAVHMINQLWDANYWKSNSAKTAEDKRPWPVFFKALLTNPLTISSSQLFAGYSSSMFNVESWLHEKLHEKKSNTNVYNLKKDWHKKADNQTRDIADADWDFPATFKSTKMKDLIAKYEINSSSSFPRNPVIFSFEETPEWKQFLKYEGSTSHGFLTHREKIKNILQNMIYKTKSKNPVSSFPGKQLVDWSRAKLSVTRLELEQAMKSVLSLKNQMSTLLDSFVNIKFNTMLGEYISRDALLVTVNMMLEDGSMTVLTSPIFFMKPSVYSTFLFWVNPNFDMTKLSEETKAFLRDKAKVKVD